MLSATGLVLFLAMMVWLVRLLAERRWFSIFFWGTALGGILGMVLAIPLTAFFLVFWRLARQKYLPALIQQQQADEAPQS